jgi:hypothetical protein
MEPKSAAEALPALYRAVLDRVAELEAGGDRDLAKKVRADATRIYSRSWDARAYRNLDALLRRSDVDAPIGRQLPGRGFRRRSARAT